MSSYIVYGPCVYLIKEVDTQICKIGCTADLKTRLATLTWKCGFELVVIDAIAAPTLGVAFKLETFLHKHFKSQRIRGEWFSFDAVASTWKQIGKDHLEVLNKQDALYRLDSIPKQQEIRPATSRKHTQKKWTPPYPPEALAITEAYVSSSRPPIKQSDIPEKKPPTLADLLLYLK